MGISMFPWLYWYDLQHCPRLPIGWYDRSTTCPSRPTLDVAMFKPIFNQIVATTTTNTIILLIIQFLHWLTDRCRSLPGHTNLQDVDTIMPRCYGPIMPTHLVYLSDRGLHCVVQYVLHRDLGVKLLRTPQSWYPWQQGNYFILLYGWIV